MKTLKNLVVVALLVSSLALFAQERTGSTDIEVTVAEPGTCEQTEQQLAVCTEYYNLVVQEYRKLEKVTMLHMEVTQTVINYLGSKGIEIGSDYNDKDGTIAFGLFLNNEFQSEHNSITGVLEAAFALADSL